MRRNRRSRECRRKHSSKESWSRVLTKVCNSVTSKVIGLLLESFVSQYQLDVYGFISNTNYKYIIIKNETKTTPLGQKPADD